MYYFQSIFFQPPPEIFRDVCEVVMTSSHSAEAMTAAPDLIQVTIILAQKSIFKYAVFANIGYPVDELYPIKKF